MLAVFFIAIVESDFSTLRAILTIIENIRTCLSKFKLEVAFWVYCLDFIIVVSKNVEHDVETYLAQIEWLILSGNKILGRLLVSSIAVVEHEIVPSIAVCESYSYDND